MSTSYTRLKEIHERMKYLMEKPTKNSQDCHEYWALQTEKVKISREALY